MHGLLKHLHGGDQHSHADSAPQTTGSVIHWASRYDWVVQIMALGQAGRLRRKTVEFAQITPGERVLDVGCGTGDLTLLAKERAGSAGQVCGLDAAPEMIEVARRKAARATSRGGFPRRRHRATAVSRRFVRCGVEQSDDASSPG